MSEITAKGFCDAGRARHGTMQQFLTGCTRLVRPEPASKEEG